LLSLLEGADIPSSKVYTVADIAADPQNRARGMVREVPDPHFGKVLQTGIVPLIAEDPNEVRWTGPEIGQHTNEVLREMLGLSDAEIAALRTEDAL
jgi:crotonobetainyl-CoA:carnitine CoA-transferase CaiB-like acyl-CoA transferase